MREGSGPDTGELAQRLDHLHETLEDLQGNVRERPTTEEAALLSPTLRTILARQSLLISAVFNLTEMVEELLLASGKPRKAIFGDVEGGVWERASLTEPSGRPQLESPVELPAATQVASRANPRPVQHATLVRRERFGSLRQRRRRGALAVLSVLVVGALLAWAIPVLSGERASDLSFLMGQEAKVGSERNLSQSENSKAADGEASGNRQDEGAAGTAVGSRPAGSEAAGQVEVPDVSNREVEEATRILSDAGLTVAAAKNEASPQEIGTLMGTEPAAGSTVEPGTPVTLVLSGGPSWVPPESGSQDTGPAAEYGN